MALLLFLTPESNRRAALGCAPCGPVRALTSGTIERISILRLRVIGR